MKKLITILFFLPFLASAHVITANGDAQIDTAQSKFGGASGLFDGTGDTLTIPDSDDFNFGAGDFTVEWFARFVLSPGDSCTCGVFEQRNTAANKSYLFQGNDVANWQWLSSTDGSSYNRSLLFGAGFNM